MRRVVVYGNGGSGKSTLARDVAAAIGGEAIEIDTLAFEGEYQHVDPTALRAAFTSRLAPERWVVEGMHRDELNIALREADTFVWLDLPRHTVARRLLWRVALQLVSKRERHGRRTTLRSIRRREGPFIRKTLASHERRREHGQTFFNTASSRGMRVVHLNSAGTTKQWLQTVTKDD